MHIIMKSQVYNFYRSILEVLHLHDQAADQYLGSMGIQVVLKSVGSIDAAHAYVLAMLLVVGKGNHVTVNAIWDRCLQHKKHLESFYSSLSTDDLMITEMSKLTGERVQKILTEFYGYNAELTGHLSEPKRMVLASMFKPTASSGKNENSNLIDNKAESIDKFVIQGMQKNPLNQKHGKTLKISANKRQRNRIYDKKLIWIDTETNMKLLAQSYGKNNPPPNGAEQVTNSCWRSRRFKKKRHLAVVELSKKTEKKTLIADVDIKHHQDFGTSAAGMQLKAPLAHLPQPSILKTQDFLDEKNDSTAQTNTQEFAAVTEDDAEIQHLLMGIGDSNLSAQPKINWSSSPFTLFSGNSTSPAMMPEENKSLSDADEIFWSSLDLNERGLCQTPTRSQ